MVAELEFVRNPAPDAGKKPRTPAQQIRSPWQRRAGARGFTLSKLHFPSAPSRTFALLRLPNPSLDILKSVTGLDIYRFMTFISGCVSGVKPTTPSLFPKLRHLTSVTHLTF